MATKSQHDHLRHVLLDPQSFAKTLFVVYYDQFGSEGVGWLPETVRAEINQEWHVQIAQDNFDRLLAAIAIVTTDRFANEPDCFEPICRVLNRHTFDAGILDHMADVYDCAWGLTEGLLLYPPHGDEPYLSEDVRAYLGAALDQAGILVPPDILKLASRPENLAEKARSGFSDDPTMFSAIWKSENDKTTDINVFVKGQLKELIDQLESLPLHEGRTAQAAKRLASSLT